jgi:hypothetical protein
MNYQIIITLKQKDSDCRYYLLLGNPMIETAEGLYCDCEYWICDINPFVFDDEGRLSDEVGMMAETSMRDLGRLIHRILINDYEVESMREDLGETKDNDDCKNFTTEILESIWGAMVDGDYDENDV